jgi:hypothetical protein
MAILASDMASFRTVPRRAESTLSMPLMPDFKSPSLIMAADKMLGRGRGLPGIDSSGAGRSPRAYGPARGGTTPVHGRCRTGSINPLGTYKSAQNLPSYGYLLRRKRQIVLALFSEMGRMDSNEL